MDTLDQTTKDSVLEQREAAVVFSERITDRREEAAERRENAAGLRETGAAQRERALRPKEEAARRETELRVKTQAQLKEANKLARSTSAEVAKLENLLQNTQKLETFGALAGGVAHDFNNLLTTIVGNANLGSLALQEHGDAAHHFDAIGKAAVRAAALTNQLLAYAGRGKSTAHEIDLNGVVNDILLLLEVSIPNHLVLDLHLAERLPFVMGDTVQIFQVLMNLITNAGEAFVGRDGGVIAITTAVETVAVEAGGPGRWFLPVPAGCFATLEVRDSGCGMTPEVLAKVFDPYFTTKATGHGLGLAAVLGIIRSHGGGLWGESEPGQGTTFKMLLPVREGPRSSAAKETRATWRGDGQILVVDPDYSVRRGLGFLASQCGFSVIEALDNPEALALFRLHHDHLDWVLLAAADVNPEWEAVFQELRAIDPTVPVVLGCGLAFSSEGLPEGLAGLLRKPYRAAEFQNLLRRTPPKATQPERQGPACPAS